MSEAVEPTYIGLAEFYELVSDENEDIMLVMRTMGDWFIQGEVGWQIVADPEDINYLSKLLKVEPELVH